MEAKGPLGAITLGSRCGVEYAYVCMLATRINSFTNGAYGLANIGL